jgi:hypothetical protein
MKVMAMSTTMAALEGAGSMIADRYGWPGQSPAAVSSATRCETTYGASPLPWGPSTYYFTSTSYAYSSRTEILTPKPSTTSVAATSTYTQYETAPNNLTRTIYTDTYSYTNYLTTTETVSSTATVTKSLLHTTTIPTQTGFIPVAAAYPEATQSANAEEDQDQWSVEDAYWQDNWSWQQEPEAPELDRPGSPTKIDCLVTLINIYDSGTTSSKMYVSPPTYTRTSYVATETTTITVTTKVSPTETPITYSMASGLEIRSQLTETLTKFETVSSTNQISQYLANLAKLILDYND